MPAKQKITDIALLKSLYVDRGMSTTQISSESEKLLGKKVTTATIFNTLVRNGIFLRSKSEGVRMAKSPTKHLSQVVKDSQERWRARWLISSGKVKSGRGSILSLMEAEKLRQFLDSGEDIPDSLIDNAVREARKSGFPYYSMTNEDKLWHWEHLCSFVPSLPFRWLGYHTELASLFHPHMFECKNRGKMSALELFSSDADLRRAVWKALCLHGKITPSILRDICRREKASSCINNFPPMVASSIVHHISKGEQVTVFDPCAGFSGRMIGCASRRNVSQYVCIDLSPHTANGLRNTSKFLLDAGAETQIDVIHGNCLESGPLLKKDFDLVLTSPPFLDEERYKDVPFETNYKAWASSFVEPFFHMCSSRLRSGGSLCLYSRSFRLNLHGFSKYAQEVAKSAGLKREHDIPFIMNRGENGRGKDGSPTYKVGIERWTKA